ncbi:hypothetical protein V8C86DRAFT_3145008 [Haematococcus lacustris]
MAMPPTWQSVLPGLLGSAADWSPALNLLAVAVTTGAAEATGQVLLTEPGTGSAHCTLHVPLAGREDQLVAVQWSPLGSRHALLTASAQGSLVVWTQGSPSPHPSPPATPLTAPPGRPPGQAEAAESTQGVVDGGAGAGSGAPPAAADLVDDFLLDLGPPPAPLLLTADADQVCTPPTLPSTLSGRGWWGTEQRLARWVAGKAVGRLAVGQGQVEEELGSWGWGSGRRGGEEVVAACWLRPRPRRVWRPAALAAAALGQARQGLEELFLPSPEDDMGTKGGGGAGRLWRRALSALVPPRSAGAGGPAR